jgi:Tfp pilus assembly protein PilX
MQEDNLMQQNLIKNADREASLMLKAADLDLRENESQLDNATKVNVTKLKDETQLNERE